MKKTIGIPRSLHYYYFFPGWEEFFTNLDFQVLVSPETNKSILEDGVRLAVEDLCLPFKSYFGHIKDLKDRADYLFIPRLLSLGKNNKVCPKFMGLPDMVRAIFRDSKLPPILDPIFDLKRGLFSLHSFARCIGNSLHQNFFRIEWAFWKGLKKQKQSINNRTKTETATGDFFTKEINNGVNNNYNLTIAVLGHSYLLYDQFLSMGLLGKLSAMGIRVITQDMIKPVLLERNAERQPKKLFWYYNRQILGAAYYLFAGNMNIDGVILVDAFACGPDALVKEIIKIRGNLPILALNLDEHSGEAGLQTRLEAFVDLLERRYGEWQTG